MWGRLLTCGRLSNRPADVPENLPAWCPHTFCDHPPQPPAAALSFCRPSYVPDMAAAWQPAVESQLSLRNRLWTSIRGHGPYTRPQMHGTALPAHAVGLRRQMDFELIQPAVESRSPRAACPGTKRHAASGYP